LPFDAVVWYDGKPWVFVKTGEQRYERRAVGAHSDSRDGWFAGEGFVPGEEVVVTGAQTLLSGVLRGQVPDEDDD
jgi:hypothetical protein